VQYAVYARPRCFFLLNRFQRARPTLPKGERGEGSCSTVLEPKFTPSTWMDHQYPLFFFFSPSKTIKGKCEPTFSCSSYLCSHHPYRPYCVRTRVAKQRVGNYDRIVLDLRSPPSPMGSLICANYYTGRPSALAAGRKRSMNNSLAPGTPMMKRRPQL
jgi:hypothetical protein